jgi:serine/threonine-protein kinase
MQLVHAISRGDFPRPRAVRPDLPPALEAIILRSMSVSANDRYDSMRALGTALVPFASDRGRSIWGGAFQASPHIVGPSSDASPSLGAPSASHKPPVAATTLERGGTAVTAETSPPAPRVGAAIAIGAGLLLAATGLAWVLTRGAGANAVPASVASASAPRYRVVLRADPSSASISLDGSPVGSGTFTADLARDGSQHTLTVGAPGFVPQTLVFRDEPPPSSVALAPLPNQEHVPNAAASGERASPTQARKKYVAGARAEPAASGVATPEPAKAGRRTDNIDPWEN